MRRTARFQTASASMDRVCVRTLGRAENARNRSSRADGAVHNPTATVTAFAISRAARAIATCDGAGSRATRSFVPDRPLVRPAAVSCLVRHTAHATHPPCANAMFNITARTAHATRRVTTAVSAIAVRANAPTDSPAIAARRPYARTIARIAASARTASASACRASGARTVPRARVRTTAAAADSARLACASVLLATSAVRAR